MHISDILWWFWIFHSSKNVYSFAGILNFDSFIVEFWSSKLLYSTKNRYSVCFFVLYVARCQKCTARCQNDTKFVITFAHSILNIDLAYYLMSPYKYISYKTYVKHFRNQLYSKRYTASKIRCDVMAPGPCLYGTGRVVCLYGTGLGSPPHVPSSTRRDMDDVIHPISQHPRNVRE